MFEQNQAMFGHIFALRHLHYIVLQGNRWGEGSRMFLRLVCTLDLIGLCGNNCGGFIRTLFDHKPEKLERSENLGG